MIHGPRRVSDRWHRITLPSPLAKELRLQSPRYALVTLSTHHDGELSVRRANKPRVTRSERDPAQPRQIGPHGQLTLPATLLQAVSLGPSQPWVYFARDEVEAAIRVIPAPLVAVEVGRNPG